MRISQRRFRSVTQTAEIKPKQRRWHHAKEGQCRIPPTDVAGIDKAVTKSFVSCSPSERRIRIGDANKVLSSIGADLLAQRFEKSRQENVGL